MIFGFLWYWWLALMFLMLIAPVGYGWGYRGWGPPYPSYLQRRRDLSTPVANARFDHYAWGWGGDLVWLVFLFWLMWAVFMFWNR